MTEFPLGPALLVIDALESLGVRYQVGGSFASSIHGTPRQTRDIDLVVDLPLNRIPAFVLRLSDTFYVEEESVRLAVRRRGSFNLIHLESGFKVDCFQRGSSDFDASELDRSIPIILAGENRSVLTKSPEDTLLRKLLWYREGGEVSTTQWQDIRGVVQTQGGSLDCSYLDRWAAELGIRELLQKALAGGDLPHR